MFSSVDLNIYAQATRRETKPARDSFYSDVYKEEPVYDSRYSTDDTLISTDQWLQRMSGDYKNDAYADPNGDNAYDGAYAKYNNNANAGFRGAGW